LHLSRTRILSYIRLPLPLHFSMTGLASRNASTKWFLHIDAFLPQDQIANLITGHVGA
jgi:hypothetical protein